MRTSRLMMRQWQRSDFAHFAQLNADPDVMRYFPRCLNTVESDRLAADFQAGIQLRGWGFWAIERLSDQQFIGFVGLGQPEDIFPFTPCVEIGWRLQKDYWGQGYATEAGHKSLEYAFDTLQLETVKAYTAAGNSRSRHVMHKLGLTNTGEDFLHPKIDAGDPLREHVLYSIDRGDWQPPADVSCASPGNSGR